MTRTARLLGALLVTAIGGLGTAVPPASAGLPPIHHVFTIILENESKATTFGTNSPAPYLAKTLVSQGAFVPNYYGTGHESNDNYISMISGQAPNVDNQSDCMFFSDFSVSGLGTYGQQPGVGCVYPSDVKTVAGQLSGAGYTWRDYNQSMGNDPTRESAVCGHPAVGSQDHTQSATATDAYATRHDPFVYFHSIIDDTTLCNTHVVNLSMLKADLASPSQTPNYVFITPDLCGDGHDASCADPSRKGGFPGIEQFLAQYVPMITGSPAFKQENGLLIVTFDEAASSDAGSCCGEIAGPGSPQPGVEGMGGGDVGAVMLSPCIKPGTVSIVPYNHYTMLRSVEDLFGLPHLGYAQLPGGASFGSDIFTGPCSSGPPPPLARPAAAITLPRVVGGTPAPPRITVRWSSATPGVTWQLQERRLLDGRVPTPWRTLLIGSHALRYVFAGQRAQTYVFRVRATDANGRHSAWRQSTVRVLRRR